MGTIKNRKCKDLAEAENIKNTQTNYIKGLNHNDVITHLEPDILQCEVKWALRSINYEQSQQR